MVIKLNEENFEKEVIKSEKPVLVDFYADWCGPCKMLSPLIDEIAEEYPQYKFCKLNVDENEYLAAKYNVMSIPTLFVFKDGQVVNHSTGAIPKENVLELFR